MNDCVNGEIRDALPDLVNGRLSRADAAIVNEHSESCADCRAELALLREVVAGAPLVPVIDAERIASAIPPYAPDLSNVRIPARKSTFNISRAWQLAAAAMVVAIGGWFAANGTRTTVEVPPAQVALRSSTPAVVSPAASGAIEPASSTVTATTTTVAPAMVASLPLVTGMSDLTDDQLEQLLTDLDGMEAVPSAEPAALTLPIEDLGGE